MAIGFPTQQISSVWDDWPRSQYHCWASLDKTEQIYKEVCLLFKLPNALFWKELLELYSKAYRLQKQLPDWVVLGSYRLPPDWRVIVSYKITLWCRGLSIYNISLNLVISEFAMLFSILINLSPSPRQTTSRFLNSPKLQLHTLRSSRLNNFYHGIHKSLDPPHV